MTFGLSVERSSSSSVWGTKSDTEQLIRGDIFPGKRLGTKSHALEQKGDITYPLKKYRRRRSICSLISTHLIWCFVKISDSPTILTSILLHLTLCLINPAQLLSQGIYSCIIVLADPGSTLV